MGQNPADAPIAGRECSPTAERLFLWQIVRQFVVQILAQRHFAGFSYVLYGGADAGPSPSSRSGRDCGGTLLTVHDVAYVSSPDVSLADIYTNSSTERTRFAVSSLVVWPTSRISIIEGVETGHVL